MTVQDIKYNIGLYWEASYGHNTPHPAHTHTPFVYNADVSLKITIFASLNH